MAADAVEQPAPALAAADVVGAHPPGDRQQPHPHRRVAAVAGEGAERPQVRLLDEVLDLAGRPEGPAHLPDGRLGQPHELADGDVVALQGGLDVAAQGIVAPARRHDGRAGSAAGNRELPDRPRGDLADDGHVECDRWREAISARLDGEDPGIDPALVDAHLARCAGCRAFATRRRRRPPRPSGSASAPDVPDLSRRVRKAVALADRAGRWSVVRALLVVVAVQILAFSLPALVLGDEQDTAAHAARHLGAFTAAYGVGLLVVAVRPARARTMLPVAAVLAGALVITAIVDLVDGRVPLVGEAQHLPEVLSVVLVWLLAVPAPRRRTRRRPARPSLSRARRRADVA